MTDVFQYHYFYGIGALCRKYGICIPTRHLLSGLHCKQSTYYGPTRLSPLMFSLRQGISYQRASEASPPQRLKMPGCGASVMNGDPSSLDGSGAERCQAHEGNTSVRVELGQISLSLSPCEVACAKQPNTQGLVMPCALSLPSSSTRKRSPKPVTRPWTFSPYAATADSPLAAGLRGGQPRSRFSDPGWQRASSTRPRLRFERSPPARPRSYGRRPVVLRRHDWSGAHRRTLQALPPSRVRPW